MKFKTRDLIDPYTSVFLIDAGMGEMMFSPRTKTSELAVDGFDVDVFHETSTCVSGEAEVVKRVVTSEFVQSPTMYHSPFPHSIRI